MHQRILDISETIPITNQDTKQWTAVIPAAGRGSRLGLNDKPKILLKIHNKPILEWIIQILKNHCHSLIFIASPQFHDLIHRKCEQILPGRCSVLIQLEPKGMANAIYLAKQKINTRHTLVMWGDQMLITPSTIQACISTHQQNPQANLTLPSIIKSKPYIHFVRDSQNRIVKVQEHREQAITSATGESDCGIFFFRSSQLFHIIEVNQKNPKCIGKSTGELNLLPMIPFFENKYGFIQSIRLKNQSESMGINTMDEATEVERVLMSRQIAT